MALPPFIIKHTTRYAAARFGRKPSLGEPPVKGMNKTQMKKYIKFIQPHIEKPSILLMDRCSSHKSREIQDEITSVVLPSGAAAFIVRLFPAKSPFLISPCDYSFIGVMTTYFYRLDRSTLELKLAAAEQAYKSISPDTIRNFFRLCGLVSTESMQENRGRITKSVRSILPPNLNVERELYDSWLAGAVDIMDAHRP